MEEFPKDFRDSVSVMNVDLLKEDAPDKMILEMVREMVGLDILVNNAGIYQAYTSQCQYWK